MTRSEADDWLTRDRADLINYERGREGLMPLDLTTMAQMISRLPEEAEREFREKYE